MGYREVVLKSESSRCLLCENAPCANACEHGVRIDRIIRSINFENQEGARYLLADNPCVSCIDGSEERSKKYYERTDFFCNHCLVFNLHS